MAAGLTLAIRIVPGAATVVGGVVHPVVKAVLKTGLIVWDGARGVIAETVSDLYAEAQHEVAAAKAAQGQSLADEITEL